MGAVLRQDLPRRGAAADEHQHHGQRQEGAHRREQGPGGPLRAGGLRGAEGERGGTQEVTLVAPRRWPRMVSVILACQGGCGETKV